jgi:hypothetical protein
MIGGLRNMLVRLVPQMGRSFTPIAVAPPFRCKRPSPDCSPRRAAEPQQVGARLFRVALRMRSRAFGGAAFPPLTRMAVEKGRSRPALRRTETGKKRRAEARGVNCIAVPSPARAAG